MVSILTIAALCFSLLCCFVFPIVLCVVFMRKTRPGALPLILGIAVFILFVLILEQLMHYAVLIDIPFTRDLIGGNTWLYATYGALAAGVFEEAGRFLAFSLFLRRKREWKHGITYGIGHGGIEAILLAFPSVLNSLIYSVLINTGSFDALRDSTTPVTAGLLEQARQSLLTEPSWIFALSGVERLCALTFQIALSVLVLYAVFSKKYIFVGLAVFLHAAIDFPAALYQRGVLPIWSVELLVVILTIPALLFIFKSRNLFAQVAEDEDPADIRAQSLV